MKIGSLYGHFICLPQFAHLYFLKNVISTLLLFTPLFPTRGTMKGKHLSPQPPPSPDGENHFSRPSATSMYNVLGKVYRANLSPCLVFAIALLCHTLRFYELQNRKFCTVFTLVVWHVDIFINHGRTRTGFANARLDSEMAQA